MKLIATQIPEDMYQKVKMMLAEKGQTMDSYIKSLVSENLGISVPESNFRTICFRIPENEYAIMKSAAISRGMTIKGFVENLILRDIREEKPVKRFDIEASRGKSKTVSFQIEKEVYDSIKLRISETDMSNQDYMRSLIYLETHQELSENMVEAQTMNISM